MAQPRPAPSPFLTWGVPAVCAALAVCVIGALGIWAGDAWLVPSIGSAALLQVMSPKEPSARPWNTAVGQLVGLACALVAVYLAAAVPDPPFMTGHPLAWSRVLAVGLAMILTVLLQKGLKATSPAGGATAVLLAVGTLPPTLSGAITLVVGILLVTALGEVCRQAVLATS